MSALPHFGHSLFPSSWKNSSSRRGTRRLSSRGRFTATPLAESTPIVPFYQRKVQDVLLLLIVRGEPRFP